MPLELDGVALEVQLDDPGRVEHRRAAHAEVEERPSALAHHLVEERSQGAQVRHQQPAPHLAGALVRRRDDLLDDVPGASTNASAVERIAAAMRGSVAQPGGSATRATRRAAPGAGSTSSTGSASGSRTWAPATASSPARTSATWRAITPSTAISWNMIVCSTGGQRRGVRHDARGRLDRGDAAAVGGVAQRAADVVAEPERAHPAGQRGGLAAARAAGGDGRVPRVAGQAAQRGVGVHAQAEVGQVGPGERDRPGRAHPLDHRRVDRGDGLLERRHPVGGGRAGDVDVLLDGDRDAVERAERRAPSATARSARSAAAAASGSRATTALRSPLTCSMRARRASRTSRLDASCLRISVGELQSPQLPEFGLPFAPIMAARCWPLPRWRSVARMVGLASGPRTLAGRRELGPASPVVRRRGACRRRGRASARGGAWRVAAPRRQPGPAGRRQLRQRLQRRRARHRRRPGRAGAARRLGAEAAGRREAGGVRWRSASPPSAGLALAATTTLVAARRRRGGDRRGVGSTPAGREPYGYAGLGELFVFVFFGLVATVGTTYVAVERGDRAVAC